MSRSLAVPLPREDPFLPVTHDHATCVQDALRLAGTVCAQRGQRLTELRQQVLEIIWDSHAPAGAYEIMQRLSARRGRVAPATVYRTLDFLCREGLVHRLDSLNAFTGCSDPLAAHRAFFLICRECRNVVEIHDNNLDAALEQVADQAGFAVERAAVELSGCCARCRSS
jgi:Fur family zinc uptake transcriptional regulator